MPLTWLSDRVRIEIDYCTERGTMTRVEFQDRDANLAEILSRVEGEIDARAIIAIRVTHTIRCLHSVPLEQCAGQSAAWSN